MIHDGLLCHITKRFSTQLNVQAAQLRLYKGTVNEIQFWWEFYNYFY